MNYSGRYNLHRWLILAVVLLGIMTFSMILLRVIHSPAYLWIAMVSPVAGVASSALHAWSFLGSNRAVKFILITGLGSLFLESFGVATGLLYGRYHYTYRLGPLFLGLTPYLIPVTWFMMLYPSYVMSVSLVRKWKNVPSNFIIIIIAAVGGLIMSSWDLVLDPVMVKQEHWVWETPGGYFGVPFQNYFGWWLTSFLILLAYQLLIRTEKSENRYPAANMVKIAIFIYAIIGLGNIAGAAITGLWGPALIALGAMGFWAAYAWKSSKNVSNLLTTIKS